MPKHEDLKDPLEFPAHELKKYFRMGDHVKVIAGRYEGDTGLIVRVEENLPDHARGTRPGPEPGLEPGLELQEENFVILFSDLTMHE
ncbi:hypothetical protein WMY93_030621, partial [Mugilogobius chulae]